MNLHPLPINSTTVNKHEPPAATNLPVYSIHGRARWSYSGCNGDCREHSLSLHILVGFPGKKKTKRQGPLLAQSVCGVCVCGWNELEVCTTFTYPHIGSFCTMSIHCIRHKHTCILKRSEDSEPTGLKVDIATKTCLNWDFSPYY